MKHTCTRAAGAALRVRVICSSTGPLGVSARVVAAWVAAASLAVGVAPAMAQDYPSRPVRLVAPFSAGGSSDLMSRIIAQKLTDSMGQAVTVENRPGAGGNIGHEMVSKTPADGYTLVFTNSASLVNNIMLYKRLGFDPVADFVPITLVGISGSVLVVPPALPVKNVSELVARAKANPGKLNYGSGGRATTAHIMGEVFKTATGINIVHVPYKGSNDAVVALMASQIEIVFSDTAPAISQVKGGKLRALASVSDRRYPALPDVPTLIEAGVPGETPTTWWGIAAPRGTPPAVIAKLNAEIGKALQQPDAVEKFTGLGVFPLHTKPEQVTERIKVETPMMAKIFKAAGVEPE